MVEPGELEKKVREKGFVGAGGGSRCGSERRCSHYSVEISHASAGRLFHCAKTGNPHMQKPASSPPDTPESLLYPRIGLAYSFCCGDNLVFCGMLGHVG